MDFKTWGILLLPSLILGMLLNATFMNVALVVVSTVWCLFIIDFIQFNFYQKRLIIYSLYLAAAAIPSLFFYSIKPF